MTIKTNRSMIPKKINKKKTTFKYFNHWYPCIELMSLLTICSALDYFDDFAFIGIHNHTLPIVSFHETVRKVLFKVHD